VSIVYAIIKNKKKNAEEGVSFQEGALNRYLKDLCRIEFVITYACTGRCKHCSEGEHGSSGEHISSEVAARAVYDIAENYSIGSLMTFGGEPLLYPDTVCAIHSAARDAGIKKRQIITNGFFSSDKRSIRSVAQRLFECGVNDVLLSVDAFHQESIPIETVKLFAEEVKRTGVCIRTQPAWLVSVDDTNPYNTQTREILRQFSDMGIEENEGNIIFPSGNALIYLKDYFDKYGAAEDPYKEDPNKLRTVSFEPDGYVLGGNVYREGILSILEKYQPK